MKIYYINRDQSTARRDWMESQLSQLANDKIQYSRISAVEGATLTEAEINAVTDYDQGATRKLSVNEVGCFLSHRKAWQLISDSPDEYGVVMEDDVLLSSKVDLFLSNTNWIPKGTAYIRLEANDNYWMVKLFQCHQKGTIADVNYELFEFEGGGGGGAYVIHKELAKWLLPLYTKFSIPVDDALIDPELFVKGIPTQLPGSLRLQMVPLIAIQQLCYKNRFLPLGAEVSSLQIKKKRSTRSKLGRELLRVVSLKHWKRTYSKLIGPKFPFLE